MGNEQEQKVTKIKSSEVSIVDDTIKDVKKAYKQTINSIYLDVEDLVGKAKEVSITDSTSKEEYEEVKTEIWRPIRQTRIAIENKRKELNKPISKLKSNLDDFAKSIHDPLKKVEDDVREQMKVFEDKEAEERKKKKEKKEKERKEQERIQNKLNDLNQKMQDINNCKIKSEVEKIEKELQEVNLEEFKDSSDQAGFIVQNLEMMAKTVKNALPEKLEEEKKESVKEETVESSKSDSETLTDKTKSTDESNNEDPKDSEDVKENKQVDSNAEKNITEKTDVDDKSSEKSSSGDEANKKVHFPRQKHVSLPQFQSSSNNSDKMEDKRSPKPSQNGSVNMELDFETVCDQQNEKGAPTEGKSTHTASFDRETADSIAAKSALPLMVTDEVEGNSVISEVIVVDDINFADSIPQTLDILSIKPNGTKTRFKYSLIKE